MTINSLLLLCQLQVCSYSPCFLGDEGRDVVFVVIPEGGQTTTNAVAAEVMSIKMDVKSGMFNPYTINGRIVVDGVVASAHSDWFLDPLAPSFAVPYLPATYQALLSPLQLLHSVLLEAFGMADKLAHSPNTPDGWLQMSSVDIVAIALKSIINAAISST